MTSGSINYSSESPSGSNPEKGDPWKVLSVDDNSEVHAVTKLVLSDFEFDGRYLDIVTANSAKEANEYLRKHQDVALVLLDVVMERDHAGFDVVRTIREELNNHQIRIVIRTGQAGSFDLDSTMGKYDVDGYVNKSDLSSNYLHATVYSALRSYRDAQTIVKNQANQAEFIKKIQALNFIRDTDILIEKMISDLHDIIPDIVNACIVIANENNEDILTREIISNMSVDDKKIIQSQRDYLQYKSHEKNSTIQIKNQILFRHDLSNGEIFKLHLVTRDEINDERKALFVAYCSNVSSLYELGQVTYK